MSTRTIQITGAIAGAAAVVGVTAGVTTAEPVASSDGRAGVCGGVKHCHRVATVDVDGDRRADRVGWHQLGKKRVQIRVLTADGDRLRRKVNVSRWPGGGTWGDAAWIDGRPGAELLVGSLAGAHTPHYTMLTYRKGDLVIEKSPAKAHSISGRWAVDSAATVYLGWHRHVGKHGRVTMTEKSATLRPGSGHKFKGHNTRYTWTKGHWKRVSRTKHTYRNARKARKIAGWHVAHLDRWPGR